MKKYKHIILSLTAISTIATPLFFSSCSGSGSNNHNGQDTIRTDTLENIVVIDALTISKVNVDPPTLNDKKGTYSFDATATLEGPGKEKAVVVYTLTKVGADNTEAKISENENGKFSEIEGLKDKEIFILEAFVKGSPDIKGEYRLFQESIPLVEQVKKLNTSELTTIIMSYANGDNTSYEANKDCLATDCDYYATDGKKYYLGAIAEAIGFGDWKSIEFTSVEYDSFNRICKATFKINYPN